MHDVDMEGWYHYHVYTQLFTCQILYINTIQRKSISIIPQQVIHHGFHKDIVLAKAMQN